MSNAERRETEMEVVGWVAVTAAVVVVIGGAVIGLRSIPDARRYLRMRRM